MTGGPGLDIKTDAMNLTETRPRLMIREAHTIFSSE